MALLVNVLAIFSSFLAPLIFYLVKKDSRFVSFYSLQVLIWHAAYALIFFVGMVIAMIFMFATVASQPHGAPNQSPPWAFFGAFGLVWLWGMGGWVLNLVIGIVYAIKANQGEWARFPLIGDFVLRKILPVQPIFLDYLRTYETTHLRGCAVPGHAGGVAMAALCVRRRAGALRFLGGIFSRRAPVGRKIQGHSESATDARIHAAALRTAAQRRNGIR
jgi:uncharacterized Tic20 family protein